MKLISLYDLEQPALILLDNGGAKYMNQVGGTACLQKSEHGYLFPLSNDQSNGLLDIKLSEACRDLATLTVESALKIESCLSHLAELDIKVQISRLAQSSEAWVYVQSNHGDAVLTWCNSD